MNKEINNQIFAEAYAEWAKAEHGIKSYVVKKWAKTLGVAYQTMYSKLKNFGFKVKQKKQKHTKGKAIIPNLHEWVKTVSHLYGFLPRSCNRRPPLDLVIRKALTNGMLPAEASNVSVGTFQRVLREQKLLDKQGRCLRFEAKTPMEQIQYDCSGSEYLYVHRFDENNEPILRVRSSKAYKNRDRYENLRLWYHGMVDDNSRYWLAMAFVAPGESSADAIQFCKWAFSKKTDSRIIFRGLPSRVYMDCGALARAETTKEFMNRIGVEIKTHEPNSPEDTGKIEIRWKLLWSQFETPEFLMDPHWDKREYKLSEIQQRLTNYTYEANQKKHPNFNSSKESAWLKVMQTGGVVDINESVFDTVFKRSKRLVGKDGIVKLDKYNYFVKGLYDSWVYIYEGIFDGSIVAEDILSHKRYEVEMFNMPGLDEIKQDKKLSYEKVREEADEIKKQFIPGEFKGIYQDASAQQNLIPLIRTKETKEVADPFNVDNFSSLPEAMKEFYEIVGIAITQEQREIIESLIKDNGCKKAFVTDLAMEIRASLESQRVAL